MAIRIQNKHFVDASGNTIQLRGVNVSGLESIAMQGALGIFNLPVTINPWGDTAHSNYWEPQYDALVSWKINAIRLPMNEQSWLGYTCQNLDSPNNTAATTQTQVNLYRQTVQQTVAKANAAGLYVILDLHWSAPGTICPTRQMPMADTDHSLDFWTSVANTYKNNPAVIFELFNEPWPATGSCGDDWNQWQNGATTSAVCHGFPNLGTWTSAGMQQLLDTVRATGATNVVLAGGQELSNDLTQWVAHMPRDPQAQLGAAWHIYPPNPYNNAASSTLTNMVAGVLAQVPIAITEIGDANGDGVTASFAPPLIRYADQQGISTFGWTWNPWGDSGENVLIKTDGHTPTGGWGQYLHDHYICRAGANPGSCQ